MIPVVAVGVALYAASASRESADNAAATLQASRDAEAARQATIRPHVGAESAFYKDGEITIGLRNAGSIPAKSIRLLIWWVRFGERSIADANTGTYPNELFGNAIHEIHPSSRLVTRRYYLVIWLSYNDSITGKPLSQKLYFKTPDLSPGPVLRSFNFDFPDTSEAAMLDKVLANELARRIAEP